MPDKDFFSLGERSRLSYCPIERDNIDWSCIDSSCSFYSSVSIDVLSNPWDRLDIYFLSAFGPGGPVIGTSSITLCIPFIASIPLHYLLCFLGLASCSTSTLHSFLLRLPLWLNIMDLNTVLFCALLTKSLAILPVLFDRRSSTKLLDFWTLVGSIVPSFHPVLTTS